MILRSDKCLIFCVMWVPRFQVSDNQSLWGLQIRMNELQLGIAVNISNLHVGLLSIFSLMVSSFTLL
jgi:hypothetical protein